VLKKKSFYALLIPLIPLKEEKKQTEMMPENRGKLSKSRTDALWLDYPVQKQFQYKTIITFDLNSSMS